VYSMTRSMHSATAASYVLGPNSTCFDFWWICCATCGTRTGPQQIKSLHHNQNELYNYTLKTEHSQQIHIFLLYSMLYNTSIRNRSIEVQGRPSSSAPGSNLPSKSHQPLPSPPFSSLFFFLPFFLLLFSFLFLPQIQLAGLGKQTHFYAFWALKTNLMATF